MKMECVDKKTIVYLYQTKLDYHNLEELNKQIKSLFIKLMKVYKIDFFGYNKVSIYENKKYGSILEIEKIYNNEFNFDIIDLKLIVHRDMPFFLEFDDYVFDIFLDKIIIRNNKYYLNIDDIDNIYNYLEFGKIVYKNYN